MTAAPRSPRTRHAPGPVRADAAVTPHVAPEIIALAQLIGADMARAEIGRLDNPTAPASD